MTADWQRRALLAEKRTGVLLTLLNQVRRGEEIDWDRLDPELLTKIDEPS